MTGRVCRLSPVVCFHPKTDFVVPVAGPHELYITFEMVVPRVHMADAIADSAVSTAIHEKGV